ncbi:kinase-like domain-containing protein [Cristinia sonorae]|uniref:Kinase-like domain-containing protein n=1 Tax=Cristinia sonorae TaxID=1940300 RepID=A0A8K0UQ97_9AGAR|nr:kinase-like domain-containing protein [Cristinia sonorae]
MSTDIVTMNDHQRTEILSRIDLAIPSDPHVPTDASQIPAQYAQDALNLLWDLLDPSRKAITVTGVRSQRPLRHESLRKLALKLTVHHNILPTSFYLKGVKLVETESRGAGSIADLYLGKWEDLDVALKRLRVDNNPANTHTRQRDFCRESLLWRGLNHEHILPFLGVSKDAFQRSVSMVLPWMTNGNVRQYMSLLRQDGKLNEDNFILVVNRWLYEISLGLAYLHGEGIVHGDLHGSNVLIDDDGHVRLTDFGLGLLSDATRGNYGSKSVGAPYQYHAPEQIEPADFDMELEGVVTTATDVYAFACVCIELYTEKTPFENQSLVKVQKEVVRGGRPPRPVTRDGKLMDDNMWSLTEHCWTQQPSDRPSASEVAKSLADIVVDYEPAPPAGPLPGFTRFSQSALLKVTEHEEPHSSPSHKPDTDISTPPTISSAPYSPAAQVPPLPAQSRRLSSGDLAESVHVKDLTSSEGPSSQTSLKGPNLPGHVPSGRAHAVSVATRYEGLPQEVINSQPKVVMLPSNRTSASNSRASTGSKQHTMSSQGGRGSGLGSIPEKPNGRGSRDEDDSRRGCCGIFCC